MRRLQGVPPLARLTTLGGLFASAFAAAAPSAADLARCASIADPTARLACYDAINGNNAGGKPTAASPPAAAGAPAAPSNSRAVAEPTAAVPPPVAAAAPAAPSTFSSDPQNFGLTEAQRAPAQPQAGLQAIKARIARINESAYGRTVAVLDNGQTWVLIDGEQSGDLRPEDPITIKRGALGSFLLITPSHHSYHVRRAQ